MPQGGLGRGLELKGGLKDGKHFTLSWEADRVCRDKETGKCEFMLRRNET